LLLIDYSRDPITSENTIHLYTLNRANRVSINHTANDFGHDKIGEYTFEFKRHTYRGLFVDNKFWDELTQASVLLAKKALSDFQAVRIQHKKLAPNFK